MGIGDCISASRDLLEKVSTDVSSFQSLGRSKYNTKELEKSIQELVWKHYKQFEEDSSSRDTHTFETGVDAKFEPFQSRLVGCRVYAQILRSGKYSRNSIAKCLLGLCSPFNQMPPVAHSGCTFSSHITLIPRQQRSHKGSSTCMIKCIAAYCKQHALLLRTPNFLSQS